MPISLGKPPPTPPQVNRNAVEMTGTWMTGKSGSDSSAYSCHQFSCHDLRQGIETERASLFRCGWPRSPYDDLKRSAADIAHPFSLLLIANLRVIVEDLYEECSAVREADELFEVQLPQGLGTCADFPNM